MGTQKKNDFRPVIGLNIRSGFGECTHSSCVPETPYPVIDLYSTCFADPVATIRQVGVATSSEMVLIPTRSACEKTGGSLLTFQSGSRLRYSTSRTAIPP